ncbi:MAG: hypothetical protein KAX51_07535, partial [Chromatiaceae bacterium]|nr:hypothetical protein [Chromatiaceae bacterium]
SRPTLALKDAGYVLRFASPILTCPCWFDASLNCCPVFGVHFISNGTTINMLPMDALEMPMLVVPPVELVKKFTALAEAAHIQIEDNKQQSRTLTTLRDTLLPKLLSGELSLAAVNSSEFPDSSNQGNRKP